MLHSINSWSAAHSNESSFLMLLPGLFRPLMNIQCKKQNEAHKYYFVNNMESFEKMGLKKLYFLAIMFVIGLRNS